MKSTDQDSVEMAYIVIMSITLEGGNSCQNVRIAQRTRKEPIRNGTLGNSESRCTSALSVEISSGSILWEIH
jgi:hypothetical protein